MQSKWASALHQRVHQRLDALGNAPLHARRAGVQRIEHERCIDGCAFGIQEAPAAGGVVHVGSFGGKAPAVSGQGEGERDL